MKESNSIGEGEAIANDSEFGEKDRQEEPEAVIVEVEDDIVETAAPLFTAHPIIEHQTPVYKYEVPCGELCTGKREAVLCGNTSRPKRISTQALQSVSKLKTCLQDNQDDYQDNVKHVQAVLSSLQESIPDLARCIRGESPRGHDALEAIKKLVHELMTMLEALSVEEAFSKEELNEKTGAIDIKLVALQKSINLVCRYIETRRLSDSIPEINIISDESNERGRAIVSTTPTVFQSEVVINEPRINVVGHIPHPEENLTVESIYQDPGEGCSKKIHRNVSNGSKKKMRLRKMGSRQNSKTESDSDEEAMNIVLEAPRRVKRKTSKAKRPPEEDRKLSEEKKEEYGGEDIVYVLKVKPGQKIEQKEVVKDNNDANVLISPTESCIELIESPQDNASNSASVFVKTKRKLFTTVDEPSTETKSFVVKDLESSSASDTHESEKPKTVITTLPPIPQSPSTQRKLDFKLTPPKEPSPSIRLMIAKYNQKVEKSNKSPISSGTCTPITVRSPVLERRVRAQTVRYQEKFEKVVKSASAGNIRINDGLVAVEIPDSEYNTQNYKILKASSAEVLPCHRSASTSRNNSFHNEYAIYPPLACDSLKVITKNCGAIPKAPSLSQAPETGKKEHLYRKNKEKPTSLFLKTGAVKKITQKNAGSPDSLWRRSISSSASESWSIPDKSDNTVPKITRKYDTKHSPNDENYNLLARSLEFQASTSAPTTPMGDGERPKTPLTERALKLQKAKEEFLKGYITRSASNWEAAARNEDVWKKRLSQVSAGSETSHDECVLSKSASVGFIDTASAEKQSPDGYDSLPRSPLRLEKSPSRFGFSSLASKFRKVKMRRGSKDTPKISAVSALCRQSLSVAVDIRPEDVPEIQSRKSSDARSVFKSGSSQAIGLGALFRRSDKDKLAKSKSTNVLPQNND